MRALQTPSAFIDFKGHNSKKWLAFSIITKIYFFPELLAGLIGPQMSMLIVSKGVLIIGVRQSGALSAFLLVAVNWHSGQDWTYAFTSFPIPGQYTCLSSLESDLLEPI